MGNVRAHGCVGVGVGVGVGVWGVWGVLCYISAGERPWVGGRRSQRQVAAGCADRAVRTFWALRVKRRPLGNRQLST